MSCGNSSYYPMNYYHGFYPDSMIRDDYQQQHQQMQQLQQQQIVPQQQAGFPMMTSGPAFATPVMPIGTGQMLPMGRVEESFIENILRFNKGKIGTFYYTYQGNSKWNAMVYRGRVETAGRDHIIISDPGSGKRYLLLMANLDWVEFDEQINYPHTEITPEMQSQLDTTE